MTPEFPYVQLPGAYRGFLRKASLWEGVDHILSVKGTRFSEEYRRFYYQDIQAFIVEKRARGGSLGWWIVLFSLLSIALGVAARTDSPVAWAALIVMLGSILVRLELSLRRSCRCSIQTAVSREVLPGLIRQAAAEAVIARLRERIAAEQGELPDQIPALEEDAIAAVRAADAAAPPGSMALDEADRRDRRARSRRGVNLATTGFLVLMINSVFILWFASPTRGFTQATMTWIGYGFVLAETTLLLLALREIAWIKVMNSLRNFMVGALAFTGLRILASLGLAIGLTGGGVSRRPLNYIVFMRYYGNVSGILQFAFAAAGLILIFAKWESYRRGESSSK